MKDKLKDTIMQILLHDINEIDLTEVEKTYINELPRDEVFIILKEIYLEQKDRFIQAKAYDAILSIEKLDKVQFLVDMFDNGPIEQKSTHCYELGYLDDQRAAEKLCAILLDDYNPNVRYIAATSLANFDDKTSVNTLEYACKHDFEENFEGISVSQMAAVALQRIQQRNRQ